MKDIEVDVRYEPDHEVPTMNGDRPMTTRRDPARWHPQPPAGTAHTPSARQRKCAPAPVGLPP
jgi:hypothetical protein